MPAYGCDSVKPALFAYLTRDSYQMPVSLLVGASTMMPIIFAVSLAVGLLDGPVLLIVNLIKKAL
jgi:hypothetical protein